MKFRSGIGIGIALLVLAPVHGADLLGVYRLAKQNDPSFAAAQAQYQADQERLPQGLALLLPVIEAEAGTNINDLKNRSDLVDVDNRFNDHGWSVSLTQPIFRWENFVQYKQAGFQVQQAGAVFEQSKQDLIVRVADAYFNVLAAQDTLAFTRAEKISISEQLAQAKRNFEVGTATITDTNEAQARYDLSAAQEIAALNDLEIAQRALEQITASLANELTPLKPDLRISPPQPNDMNQWVEGALSNNLGIKANEAALEVATREIERQRAGHYPTVDLVASYQDSTTNQGVFSVGGPARIQTEGSTIGLQLNMPLFAGGAVNSRTREAVALRERARSNLEGARRSAQFDARQSFLNVKNGQARVLALEQALVSSETALKSNRVGYEVGVRINIDVLDAQQQVYQTQRDLARARYDTIISGLRLKAAAGTLNEQDVEAVNTLLAGR